MTLDTVIAFDTVVVRSSCLIVFIVYLLHCICRYFFPLTVHVYSYIQRSAASVFSKFSVSVSVNNALIQFVSSCQDAQ